MVATQVIWRLLDTVDACPWSASVGRADARAASPRAVARYVAPPRPTGQLYTSEERARRDASPWTVVQGVLAPLQFLVFLVSLCLVFNYLGSGTGAEAATVSVVVKTGTLFTIMITGAIWEHAVFGRYLFAPAFFWEDAVSMIVIALHTAYLVALLTGALAIGTQMLLALAAYAAYLINASQFVLKLRAARREPMAWGATAQFGLSK